MEFLTRIVGGELFASVALVAVPWLVAKLFGWWKAECRRKGDADHAGAVEALEVGVDEAWERFGREWKHARASSSDEPTGKLSDEEREHLRTVARDVAVEVGRGKGLDVLKVIGVRALGTLIKKIVQRRKRGR
jgi:hypothetical protein